jgi:hypothetical protein
MCIGYYSLWTPICVLTSLDLVGFEYSPFFDAFAALMLKVIPIFDSLVASIVILPLREQTRPTGKRRV